MQSENELLAQVLKVGAVGPVYYNEKQENFTISKYKGYLLSVYNT
jgi:hypothetical protein